jgi:hypothetical protein
LSNIVAKISGVNDSKFFYYSTNNVSFYQVGNAIDAWEKFLELHESVMTWCSEKQALVSI